MSNVTVNITTIDVQVDVTTPSIKSVEIASSNVNVGIAPIDVQIDVQTPSVTVVTIGNEPLPVGGTTGQVLTKQSATDGDADWQNVPTPNGLLPAGGTTGSVPTKQSGADYDYAWEELPNDLPSGGTTDQVLKKLSATDYDVDWGDEAGGGTVETAMYQVGVYQTIGSGSWTQVEINTVIHQDAAFNHVPGTDNLNVPVTADGKYKVHGLLGIDTFNSNFKAEIHVTKNSTTGSFGTSSQHLVGSISTLGSISFLETLDLVNGDTIGIWIRVDVGDINSQIDSGRSRIMMEKIA